LVVGFGGFGQFVLGRGQNPKSPIPNPQSPIPNRKRVFYNLLLNFLVKINL
jgi:hypothetical protein